MYGVFVKTTNGDTELLCKYKTESETWSALKIYAETASEGAWVGDMDTGSLYNPACIICFKMMIVID